MTTYYTHADSPLGPLLLTANGAALTGLFFYTPSAPASHWIRDDQAAPFPEARQQLAAYFAGERTDFTLPLAPVGTAFQLRVWDALRAIPYGATCSYGDLAQRLGSPGAARAVGLANGKNPLCIIVPCHRVLGTSGRLTGYSGGMERKAFLLDLEKQKKHPASFEAGRF